MNHLLCARCDAVLEHLNALLGHYQEVHGGVPKPRFVVESSKGNRMPGEDGYPWPERDS